MNAAIRRLVRERARWCCEYCGLPMKWAPFARFHIEHIVARQHHGGDEAINLALACNRCNLSKGPNLTGIDPQTGKVVLLFNPRRQKWSRHFRWDGTTLIGRTPVGRATIIVLDMNHAERIELREELMDEGAFPPAGFR